MVGIVLVSHSPKIAEGILELVLQMAPDYKQIVACGGTSDGEIGTDPVAIMTGIQQVNDNDGVVILVDIGSAIMSAEMALELLEGENLSKIIVADGPIVEGALNAAVSASIGSIFEDVIGAVEDARTLSKL